MRFRTWTATSISVARRSSVRERSPSQITRLNRPMVASARARVVARGLLPAHPALLGDELQVAVPLRRRGLGRGAGHGGRARRNGDGPAPLAPGPGGANTPLVGP